MGNVPLLAIAPMFLEGFVHNCIACFFCHWEDRASDDLLKTPHVLIYPLENSSRQYCKVYLYYKVLLSLCIIIPFE